MAQKFQINCTSVTVCLSSIPLWNVSKYCPISKNKNYYFTTVSIIPLLYFQNYSKRKITNILKNQFY